MLRGTRVNGLFSKKANKGEESNKNTRMERLVRGRDMSLELKAGPVLGRSQHKGWSAEVLVRNKTRRSSC